VLLRFWRSLAGDRSIAPGERVLTLEAADALLRQRPAA
jgi:hypothetical protein